MARSVWKGPFVDGYLLKKAEAARVRPQRRHQDLEPPLHDPAAVRRPDLRRLQRPEAHPGHVSEDMVGHKFGEFSPTRTFHGHAADKKAKSANMGKPKAPRAADNEAKAVLRMLRGQPAEAEPGRAADPRQEGRATRSPISSSRASAHRARREEGARERHRQRREQPRPRRRRPGRRRGHVGKALVMKRFHARGRGRAAASRSRSRTSRSWSRSQEKQA
jgi:small subunit ribosomal protein S19